MSNKCKDITLQRAFTNVQLLLLPKRQKPREQQVSNKGKEITLQRAFTNVQLLLLPKRQKPREQQVSNKGKEITLQRAIFKVLPCLRLDYQDIPKLNARPQALRKSSPFRTHFLKVKSFLLSRWNLLLEQFQIRRILKALGDP